MIDAIYYNFISDGKSDLSPTSYSGNNGDIVKYHSRWERLDYTKAMTGDKYYGLNAWRYFSEYSFHMYGWIAFHKFYDESKKTGLAGIPYKLRDAEVSWNAWDTRLSVNIFTVILGLLGI